MTGDCHVRFCERLGAKLPRPTDRSGWDASVGNSAHDLHQPLNRRLRCLPPAMEAHRQVMAELDPGDRPIIQMGRIEDRYETLLTPSIQDLAQQPTVILRGRGGGVWVGGKDRFAYIMIGPEAEVGHGARFRVDPRDSVVEPALCDRAGGDITIAVRAARPRGVNGGELEMAARDGLHSCALRR